MDWNLTMYNPKRNLTKIFWVFQFKRWIETETPLLASESAVKLSEYSNLKDGLKPICFCAACGARCPFWVFQFKRWIETFLKTLRASKIAILSEYSNLKDGLKLEIGLVCVTELFTLSEYSNLKDGLKLTLLSPLVDHSPLLSEYSNLKDGLKPVNKLYDLLGAQNFLSIPI